MKSLIVAAAWTWIFLAGVLANPASGDVISPYPRMNWSQDYGAYALSGGEILDFDGGDGLVQAFSPIHFPWGNYMSGYAYPYTGQLKAFASGWPAGGYGEMYDTWIVQGDPGWIKFSTDVTGSLKLCNDDNNPDIWVGVKYEADLYSWDSINNQWATVVTHVPWPTGNVLGTSAVLPVTDHFEQQVWAEPGDRFLTASGLMTQAVTWDLYDPSTNYTGEADFRDTAVVTLVAVDPGVILTPAAPEVPEPSSVLLLALGGGLIVVCPRIWKIACLKRRSI